MWILIPIIFLLAFEYLFPSELDLAMLIESKKSNVLQRAKTVTHSEVNLYELLIIQGKQK